MSTDHTSNSAVLATQLASLAAVLAVVVGAMVLFGWASDIAVLKSVLPGWVSMKANTAVCFILIGVALLLTTRPPATLNPQLSTFLSRLARFCGLLAGLIGLLTLIEYISGWNPGIDQWLIREAAGAVGTSDPGRMAPEAALCFVLLSVALQITGGSRKTRWTVLASVILGLLVTTLALAAMLSYATPGLGPYGWFGLTIMAMNTAILFAMLGMAVIAISWQPDVLSWSLSRHATAAFACGMAVLVFIGFTTSRSQFWMKKTSDRIAYIEKVEGDIESILAEVVDAHVHSRDYLITGDERFLKFYLSAKADGSMKLDELRRVEFVVVEPAHQQHFARIEAQAKAQFQWLQQIIDARRTGMTDAARNDMTSHAQGLLDGFRATLEQAKNDHHQIIQRLKQESESVSRLSYLIISIGTLASLLIFLTVTFRLNFSVNERKLAEAKIRRMNQLYNLLSQCNQAVVRSANQEELFQHICRDAVQLGGFKLAWIGLVDEASKQVVPVASYGEGVEYLEGIKISVDAADPSGCGQTGTSIRENRPFWCQDFMNDPATAPWHESGTRFGWCASAALPLHRNGVAIGAFSLYSGKANAFDEAARKLLVEMAADISFALDHFAVEAERNQAEQSQARLVAILEAAPDFVGFADAKDTHILFINKAGRKMTGLSEDEDVTKLKIADVHPEWMNKKFNDEINPVAIRDGKWMGDGAFLNRNNGREIPVMMALLSHKAPSGEIEFFSTISRDITERKQAEEKLRLHGEIERNMAEAVYLIRTSDGVIVHTNPIFEHMFGYEPGEMVGKHVSIVNAPGDKSSEAVANEVISSLMQTGVWNGEVHNIRKDGTTFWCHANVFTFEHPQYGRVWLSMHQDITERKRVEETLRETRDYLENLFNHANAPIIVWNPSYQITMFNHAFERLTGRDANEVIGKQIDILFPADRKDEALAHIHQTKTGERWETIEIPILHSSGAVRTALWNSATLYSADGKNIVATMAQGQDITERKRAEFQLAEQVGELRRWHEATLGRETRTLELKHEVNELLGKSGQPPRYPSAEQSNAG